MEQKLFFSLDVQEVLYTSTAATVFLFHISADNGDTMDYLATIVGTSISYPMSLGLNVALHLYGLWNLLHAMWYRHASVQLMLLMLHVNLCVLCKFCKLLL